MSNYRAPHPYPSGAALVRLYCGNVDSSRSRIAVRTRQKPIIGTIGRFAARAMAMPSATAKVR